MNQVETVALWAGLIGSIVGAVLGVVAIVFSLWVNQRASEVSDYTIQALQKIESTVERLSQDTNGLIKAAWDKMLSGQRVAVGDDSLGANPDVDAPALAKGIAAELREELRSASSGPNRSNVQTEEAISDAVGRLEQAVAMELKRSRQGSLGAAVDSMVEATQNLSPEAVAVLRAVVGLDAGSEQGGRHLTRSQSRRLSEDATMGQPMLELRAAGLLVPRTSNNGELVYFAPTRSETMRTALLMAPVPSPETQEKVARALKGVGYLK